VSGGGDGEVTGGVVAFGLVVVGVFVTGFISGVAGVSCCPVELLSPSTCGGGGSSSLF